MKNESNYIITEMVLPYIYIYIYLIASLYVLLRCLPAVPSPRKCVGLRLFVAYNTSFIGTFGQPDSFKSTSLKAAVYTEIRFSMQPSCIHILVHLLFDAAILNY